MVSVMEGCFEEEGRVGGGFLSYLMDDISGKEYNEEDDDKNNYVDEDNYFYVFLLEFSSYFLRRGFEVFGLLGIR